ncbi:helix-turn-helix domain-containing protein [Polynucleobacter rarus]|uniref:helix-turn-helix domain-containing protein n=1 Tax=Polynucleobacter rarus TaxID=556055 RepID=UPI000D3E2CEF|nr:helix-turn-helix transcriptional regulator [Polynucleobacter rarus]
MSIENIAADIGQNIRLARASLCLQQEELAKLSGVSLQAIKNLEGDGKVKLITFLRVAKALNIDKEIWQVCQPRPNTLDELQRIESARASSSRVRILS